MIVEDSEALYSWLCEVLPPVCSADPNILAKYIIALLRKDRPENHLRQSCLSQLKIFLLECTEEFVDKLFDALKHKRYIKNKENSEKSVSSKSRRNDRRRSRKSSKRKSTDEHSSLKRRSKDSDSEAGGGYNESCKDNNKSSDNRQEKGNARNEIKRPFCKDFEEVGVCVLGDCCPYDHGPHPLSVGTALLKNSAEDKEGEITTLNPIQAVISNPMPVINANLFGMLESYNPELPAVNYSHKQRPVSRNIITVVNNSEPLPRESKFKGTGTWARPISQKDSKDSKAFAEKDYKNNSNGVQQCITERYVNNRSCCALEVKKIPIEFNNITKLNEHFGKFGKIVNVGISFDGNPDSALIVFSNAKEAETAYKCPEPVFSNRFVKVFWHNSKPTKTTVGQESKPPISKPVYFDPSVFKTVRNNPNDLKRKHEDKKLQVHLKILDELLAKQKVLMEKLEFAKTLQEKKPILKTLEEVAAVVAKQSNYLKSYQTATSLRAKRRALAIPANEYLSSQNKKSLFSINNVVPKPANSETASNEQRPERAHVSVAQIPTDLIPSVVEVFKVLGSIDVNLGRENEVIATFSNRSEAEQVVVNGIKVKDRCLMVSWYSNSEVPVPEKIDGLSSEELTIGQRNDDLKIQEDEEEDEPTRFWRSRY